VVVPVVLDTCTTTNNRARLLWLTPINRNDCWIHLKFNIFQIVKSFRYTLGHFPFIGAVVVVVVDR